MSVLKTIADIAIQIREDFKNSEKELMSRRDFKIITPKDGTQQHYLKIGRLYFMYIKESNFNPDRNNQSNWDACKLALLLHSKGIIEISRVQPKGIDGKFTIIDHVRWELKKPTTIKEVHQLMSEFEIENRLTPSIK